MPGIETEARTPELRALKVTLNGPMRSDLEYDLRPRSVKLNPAMDLSKLTGDFLVIVMNRN